MSNLNEQDIAKIQEKKLKEKTRPPFDLTIEDKIENNLNEWSNLVTELSLKEMSYLKLKDTIFNKEQWIIDNTDFKKVYGKNNADVRKQHLQKFLKEEYELRNSHEISIDYLKRRISFLKQLIHTKTIIMEVKE